MEAFGNCVLCDLLGNCIVIIFCPYTFALDSYRCKIFFFFISLVGNNKIWPITEKTSIGVLKSVKAGYKCRCVDGCTIE